MESHPALANDLTFTVQVGTSKMAHDLAGTATMAQAPARSRARGDAHASTEQSQEGRSTVGAPVSAIPSVVSQLPCAPHISEPSERRISMLACDGIHAGGRRRRLLTGLLVCGLCGAQLRASPRARHSIEWRPHGLTNEPYAVTWSQPRYVCPVGHLAIIAEPLERLIEAAVADMSTREIGKVAGVSHETVAVEKRVVRNLTPDEPPARVVDADGKSYPGRRADIRAAILEVVVAPGRPGCNHFDPYRLRVVWRDPTTPRMSLRRLYDAAVLAPLGVRS